MEKVWLSLVVPAGSQGDARTVVIVLSEVRAIGGVGLGMLVFLQRWARDHDIQLKLFTPSESVRERLNLDQNSLRVPPMK
jgi:anti-anti-sigma regulatory factor